MNRWPSINVFKLSKVFEDYEVEGIPCNVSLRPPNWLWVRQVVFPIRQFQTPGKENEF